MNMAYCQLEYVSGKVCVESDLKLTSCSVRDSVVVPNVSRVFFDPIDELGNTGYSSSLNMC